MAPAPKKLNIIEFKRVSTDKQDLERQDYDLEQNRDQFGLNVLRTIGLKISGTQVGTAEDWQAMMADMAKSAIDGISLSAIDRLFRPKDFIAMAALQVFHDHRKVIVSTKEGYIEPWTDRGWETCMNAVMQAGKEWRELKRRVAGGRLKAHKQRKPMNTAPPYGILYRDKYSRDAEGKCQYFYEDLTPSSIGTPRREIVQMVFHWRAELGWRIVTIVHELNRRGILSAGYKAKGGKLVAPGPWTRETVRQMLRNRHYIGEHWEGAEQIDVVCPTFIEREVFRRAREMFQAEKLQSKGRPPIKHLLCGFLRCKYCGRLYRSLGALRRRATYYCGNFDYRWRKQICRQNQGVSCQAIDDVVWRVVWAHITDAKILLASAERHYNSLPGHQACAKLEQELKTVRSRMERMQRMVKAGAYDEAEGTREILADKQQIAEIEARLREAGSVIALPAAYIVAGSCDRIRSLAGQAETFAERRPVLEELVDFRVTYDRGVAEIEGKVPVVVPAYKCKGRQDAGRTYVQYIPFKIKERVA